MLTNAYYRTARQRGPSTGLTGGLTPEADGDSSDIKQVLLNV